MMTPDLPDLEVPTAPAGLQEYPALVLGVLGSLAVGLLTLIGLGGLNDGFQLGDAGVIATPLLMALATHRLTFSQKTADLMASRPAQRRAVEQRKAGVKPPPRGVRRGP